MEFKLFGQKLYLSPILDLFNGEIIMYTLHTRPTFDLVETMLIEGIQHVNENDELFLHSDQGWHYRMPQYQEILKENHMTQSMSRKGNGYDKAVINRILIVQRDGERLVY